MIKFIPHTRVDTDKWDECIRKSVNCLPYSFSWYLDIVCNNWDALVLNDYEAVFPLPSKTKFTINYSSTPFWVQQLGLFSKTCSALNRVDDFVEMIPKSYRFIELNMNFNSFVSSSNPSYVIETNTNFVLKLDKSYAVQSKLYSKNLKRNLKKTKYSALQLFKNDTPNVLIQLFREDKGKTIHHFSEADFKNLETIMHVAIYKHCGQIWMAYDEGNRPLAGLFLLFSPTRIVLLFTGNTKEGKEKAAMPFLIDSFIKEFATSGLIFDFEGSKDINLARFYKSFGAHNESYQSLKINRLPLLLRVLK
mgnify:CR=1 FL=1